MQVTAADAINIDKDVERQTPQGPRQTRHGRIGVRAGGHRGRTNRRTRAADDRRRDRHRAGLRCRARQSAAGQGRTNRWCGLDSQGNPTFDVGWAFQTKGGGLNQADVQPRDPRRGAAEPIELEDGRFLVVFTMTDTTTVGVGGAARRAPKAASASAPGATSASSRRSQARNPHIQDEAGGRGVQEQTGVAARLRRDHRTPATADDAKKIPVGETRGQGDTREKCRPVRLIRWHHARPQLAEERHYRALVLPRVRRPDERHHHRHAGQSEGLGIAGGILANQKGGDETKGFGITLQFNISTRRGRDALGLYLKTRFPPSRRQACQRLGPHGPRRP